jgi:hypothetical protein
VGISLSYGSSNVSERCVSEAEIKPSVNKQQNVTFSIRGASTASERGREAAKPKLNISRPPSENALTEAKDFFIKV